MAKIEPMSELMDQVSPPEITPACIGDGRSDASDEVNTDQRTAPFIELALSDALRLRVKPSIVREVVNAITVLRARQSNDKIEAKDIRKAIRRWPTSVEARKAEIEIAVSTLSLIPKQDRDQVLNFCLER